MEKCIFCFSETETFTNIEHIIPESLGGDKILPKGMICDKCNQYFGSKVEKPALSLPSISYTRARRSTPTKKGKYHFRQGINFSLHGDPLKESFFVVSPEKMASIITNGGGIFFDFVDDYKPFVRLLMKMGLEFLATSSDYDIYDSKYDIAREIARKPPRGAEWPYAIAHLDVGAGNEEGCDEEGFLIKEFVYKYSLGTNIHTNVEIFTFIYGWDAFAVPLCQGEFNEDIELYDTESEKTYFLRPKIMKF